MFSGFITQNALDFASVINNLSSKGLPYFFVVDFECNHWQIFQFPVSNQEIIFNFNTCTNQNFVNSTNAKIYFEITPPTYTEYLLQYQKIIHHIQNGNTYLTNLTCSSSVVCNLSLSELFGRIQAPYKIYFPGHFLCFSPETFVKISGDTIYTYPMKGTIDAQLPDAEQLIIDNEKEREEHATIVDLLRNDLSKIAFPVEVKRYRYIDKISTNKSTLLQVSSEIAGKLPNDFRKTLGNILLELLPAGSVSGAPKRKTFEIIKDTEMHQRKYFTGIAGVFDGVNLDSCVLIRFLEENYKKIDNLYHFTYKSGGGITAKSNPLQEYQELIQKIYVPVN